MGPSTSSGQAVRRWALGGRDQKSDTRNQISETRSKQAQASRNLASGARRWALRQSQDMLMAVGQ